MKVLWIVLGVLFGLCLICAGGGYYLYSKGAGLVAEAGKFADDSFKAIATNWNEQEFQRLAPKIRKDDIHTLTTQLKASLGPMKGDFKSALNALNVHNDDNVSKTYVGWNADVDFAKGKAHILMKLLSIDGKWEIIGFDVDSDRIKGAVSAEEEAKHLPIKSSR